MSGLIIEENNSLLSRPLIYKDGVLKENNIIISSNMDKMYLKFEVADKS